MEYQEVLEEQWDNTPETMKEKRGAFLMVLCILSWIGIGIGMVSELFTIISGKAAVLKQINDTEEAMTLIDDNNPMSSFLDNSQEMMYLSYENFYQVHLGTVISLLIGLLAVFLMFNLKKTGYYLYVLYCVAGMVITPIFLGTSWVIIGSVVVAGIISVGFMIMYGVNLKRMTE